MGGGGGLEDMHQKLGALDEPCPSMSPSCITLHFASSPKHFQFRAGSKESACMSALRPSESVRDGLIRLQPDGTIFAGPLNSLST